MIRIIEFKPESSNIVIVIVADGNRSRNFEFYYCRSEIPRVIWNEEFEKVFSGRYSDAHDLLAAAMNCFSGKKYVVPSHLAGDLSVVTGYTVRGEGWAWSRPQAENTEPQVESDESGRSVVG